MRPHSKPSGGAASIAFPLPFAFPFAGGSFLAAADFLAFGAGSAGASATTGAAAAGGALSPLSAARAAVALARPAAAALVLEDDAVRSAAVSPSSAAVGRVRRLGWSTVLGLMLGCCRRASGLTQGASGSRQRATPRAPPSL